MTILDQTDLENIRQHKYRGTDESLLSRYVLVHWWEFVTTLMPRWLAPNAVWLYVSITLMGCLFPLASHSILIYFCPNVVGVAPNWVYALCAFCVFMFQTLDAVDGKQARRIQYLYPLGDAFDHGSDILTFSIGAITLASMLQLDSWQTLIVVAWTVCLPSFLYDWEMRYTHTLTLGVINGPVEGVLLAAVQFLAGWYYGPLYFTKTLREITGLGWMPDVRLNTASYWLLILFTVQTVLPNIYTVWNVLRSERRLSVASSAVTMLTDLMMFGIVYTAVMAFAFLYPDILSRYTFLVCYACMFAMSDCENRQLIARLSKKPPALFSLTGITWAVAVIALSPPFNTYIPALYVVLVLLTVCVWSYFVYVYRVISEITAYLGIYCFSTRLRNPKRVSRKTD